MSRDGGCAARSVPTFHGEPLDVIVQQYVQNAVWRQSHAAIHLFNGCQCMSELSRRHRRFSSSVQFSTTMIWTASV